MSTENVLVGVMSAVIGNIPVMFAVLMKNPDLPEALMGQARGSYTFFSHLKRTQSIALGDFASI